MSARVAAMGGHRVETLASDGRDIFVISDLHLGEGLQRDGNFGGCENFYADRAFTRCLLAHQSTDAPPILVVNGDAVDFVRVVSCPQSDDDFAQWRDALRQAGIDRSEEDLRASVDKREKEYGLGTEDFKSVWKLARVVEGHPEFFAALAAWLRAAGTICILRGNHDLEWYWPAVQAYLRRVLEDRFSAPPEALERLRFVHDALLIDGELYIEHGHRFDPFSRVLGGPLLAGKTQLNLPFGCFFNRYLVNRIELHFPFVENIRPREKLLPLLIRERFFLAMKVLFWHLPLTFRLIPKRYYRYVLRRVVPFLAVFGIPLVVLAKIAWDAFRKTQPGALNSPELAWLRSSAALALSYFAGRVISFLQLREPDSLGASARDILDRNGAYRVVTFGHTHSPEQWVRGNQAYFNTGAWIPVVETSSAAVRYDRTYTFLHVRRLASGMHADLLQRWNDDAERAEPLALVQRANE